METAAADTVAAATGLVTIPKFPFLVAAYAVVFAVLFLYLVSLHVRQRQLDREVAALERRLND